MSGPAVPGMSAIDEAVTRTMRETGIVGCGVSVARDNQIMYSRGFGYARLPRTPFLACTATRCGSLAKCITALSALILADQGKLDLDAPILPILREIGIVPAPVGGSLPDPRINLIKVRDLMDHTSGLPRRATYTAWRPDRDVATLHRLNREVTSFDVVRDALGNMHLDSDPGTQFQYANANFVILARVIEARSKKSLRDFLQRVAVPRFGLSAEDVYISRNQVSPESPLRGKNEATYYQTSTERYGSFLPAARDKGQVYGEAYQGFSTEASDGAAGIACTAIGLARIIANLHSVTPALSARSIQEILTSPAHYRSDPGFDPASSEYYSKGLIVRYSGGRPWFSHGGMTNHCGGVIGYNAGYQFVAVSNWNNAQEPYVAQIMDRALTEAVNTIGSAGGSVLITRSVR